MSEAVKKLFTEISPTYDRLNHLLSLNIDKGWRKKTISMIDRESNEPFHVLDVCTGTYDLSLECVRQFPNCEITALDFSQGMLDQGMHKIQKYKDKRQINPLCGDALAMPLHDNSVDVILCGYGVRNFDDTAKGMQEFFRVLKPGGQMIVLEFFKPTRFISKTFHKTYANVIIPTFGRVISGHDSAYAYLRDSIQGFLTIEAYGHLLNETGFESIQSQDFMASISTTVSAIKPGV